MGLSKARSPNRREFCLAGIVLAVLCILMFRPAFADDIKRVVIINPYDDSVAVFVRLEASIRSEMRNLF